MENLDFINDLGSSDFESWILVQQAYKGNAFQEPILECGFNKYSGYVYIALENGISIASCFGQSVDYIITDFETGEESFYDNYSAALYHLETIQ